MFVAPDILLLPEISHGSTFFRLSEETVASIGWLTRSLERAQNSVRFACFSDGDAKIMHCGEAEEAPLREGFFRAALAEFVSVEDVLAIDLVEAGISRAPIRLNETTNPVLHVFRELRNHEIHLRQSRLRSTKKDVLWGHVDRPEEATLMSISLWTVADLTVGSFSQLRNASRYTPSQLSALVDWLNHSQIAWGIHQVFLVAVETLCVELAARYRDDSPNKPLEPTPKDGAAQRPRSA